MTLGIGDAVLLLQTFQDSAGDLNVLGVALGSQLGGDQEAFGCRPRWHSPPASLQTGNRPERCLAPMQPAKLV